MVKSPSRTASQSIYRLRAVSAEGICGRTSQRTRSARMRSDRQEMQNGAIPVKEVAPFACQSLPNGVLLFVLATRSGVCFFTTRSGAGVGYHAERGNQEFRTG